jgi:ribonuclease E
MQEATEQPTVDTDVTDGLAASAARAEAWAGEPFLRADEGAAKVLAAGTARRKALDEALAEIEGDRREPSPRWRVRFGLMLGLERVLADPEPHLASGTKLRRHQIDALAGMLTELIALNQREDEAEPNGNGYELEEDDEDDDEGSIGEPQESDAEEDDEPPPPANDDGAIRRFRFRHPTASGKTIAAAGFVEAARSLGVLILTHRRLLVTQFTNDLTTEGYADRFTEAMENGATRKRANPLTIQTYAWFARHVDSIDRDAYQLVICDEAHTALGEKTSAAIRSFPEPIYIGMTATEQLIAKQVSDVFPA